MHDGVWGEQDAPQGMVLLHEWQQENVSLQMWRGTEALDTSKLLPGLREGFYPASTDTIIIRGYAPTVHKRALMLTTLQGHAPDSDEFQRKLQEGLKSMFYRFRKLAQEASND